MGLLSIPQKIADAVPAFARNIWPHLTDAERALYEGPSAVNSARAASEVYGLLPPVRELAATARAGGAKRGWYADSYDALQRVFGQGKPDDAARFTALLAALSPQTSVQSNLKNAVNVWAGWVKAGRPTDKDKVLAIMGANVEGDKGLGSVLDAWKNNALRSLTVDDANTWLQKTAALSGPKVDSFLRNLTGITDEVTNDAWMAKLSGIDQALFGGGKRKGFSDEYGDLGIKGPGYIAQNAWTRKAAKSLGWQPDEVQETGWSTAKTLNELATQPNTTIREMEASGLVVPEAYRNLQPSTAVDVLQGGLLTDEAIAATPAFGELFTREPYASALQGAGYNLDQLPTRARELSSPYARLGTTPESLLSVPEGRALNTVANRLDSVVRRSEAESWVKATLELQAMARTPKEKRQAAQQLGKARQALRRSVHELPNMTPDPKVTGMLKAAGAPLAAGGVAVGLSGMPDEAVAAPAPGLDARRAQATQGLLPTGPAMGEMRSAENPVSEFLGSVPELPVLGSPVASTKAVADAWGAGQKANWWDLLGTAGEAASPETWYYAAAQGLRNMLNPRF